MSDLSFTPRWNNGINQLENGEPISGGVAGNANIATRQLAENVFFLRNESSEAVNTEKNRAIGRENSIESTLDTKISNEITRATNRENSIESTLDTKISNEITRATNKENSITGSINTEISRAIIKENEILQYASDVNSTLTSKIDAETSARTNSALILTNAIITANNRIDTETNRAVAAENSITNRLNGWVSFSHIGPTAPNTTGWKANDIWLDTSTEI